MKGIYVVRLPEMEENIYKIGCSKDLDQRLKSISKNTLRMSPAEIIYTKEFERYRAAEKEIHKILNEYRIQTNKEFFKCDKDLIIQTIDNINILQATKLGMKQCIDALPKKPNLALIDAVKDVDSDIDQIAIIKGDATSYSIASASILAKVYRDRLMESLDKQYPQYHIAKHKGYGTKEHIELLKKYGPSKIHRKSFIKHVVEIK